jgi:hypothetical protein
MLITEIRAELPSAGEARYTQLNLVFKQWAKSYDAFYAQLFATTDLDSVLEGLALLQVTAEATDKLDHPQASFFIDHVIIDLEVLAKKWSDLAHAQQGKKRETYKTGAYEILNARQKLHALAAQHFSRIPTQGSLLNETR